MKSDDENQEPKNDTQTTNSNQKVKAKSETNAELLLKTSEKAKEVKSTHLNFAESAVKKKDNNSQNSDTTNSTDESESGD